MFIVRDTESNSDPLPEFVAVGRRSLFNLRRKLLNRVIVNLSQVWWSFDQDE